jgi:hypothetical protein
VPEYVCGSYLSLKVDDSIAFQERSHFQNMHGS